MSKYTTGEIAKLCGITVRTVQYYDTRGLLVPTELTEGGRRLYSENDLSHMKIICFLRELGLSIDTISEMLKEENPEKIITLLLEKQEQTLKEEIEEQQTKLEKIELLKKDLKSVENISVESIGDIVYMMTNDKKLKKIRRTILLSGLPVTILQLVSIILWKTNGLWWLFVIWAVVAVPYATVISKYYFENVSYLCPECHKVFRPTFKEAFFAAHTPKTRRLTCTSCGHKGFCVEVYNEEKD